MNGILLVNKEPNCTSRDVVNKISKILKTKKVGHTGTLDPIAQGVLIICVGNTTSLAELITSNDKEYIAEVELGILTDTLDNTGKILEEKDATITKENIINALNKMIKTYEQEVPIYSAVKINGKKLYEYARENIDVELPKRSITIYDISLLGDVTYKDNKTIFKFKTKVSKGTYIRSLIRDLAVNLNTIGIMTDLTRIKQGIIDIKECFTIEDIEKGNYKFYPIDKFLTNYKKVLADKFLEQKILNGSILDNIYNKEVLFVNDKNELLALYKVYEKDNTKIKPWKMLKTK